MVKKIINVIGYFCLLVGVILMISVIRFQIYHPEYTQTMIFFECWKTVLISFVCLIAGYSMIDWGDK